MRFVFLKMSLSDVQEFILRNRRKLVFGLVGVVLISLALGFIYQEISPEVAEEDKLPSFVLADEPGRVIGRVDLSGLASVDFPTAASVYRAKKTESVFSQADAAGWAKNFGSLSSSGEVDTPLGRIYFFAKKGEELAVTSNPRALRYTRESAGGTGTIPDSNTAIQKAKEFLAAKKLPDSGSFSPAVKYLSAIGERTAETTAAEAEFVEVNFSWSVGGYDLLGESPDDTAIRIVFDQSGRAVYLSYQFMDYSFSAGQEIPLLSFSQASTALSEEAKIVLVRPVGDVKEWSLSGSPSLSFFSPENVRLVYVMQPGNDLLYPVYLFEGPGRVSGNDVQAAAYVPAVSTDYIKEE
jgi:hypothetical protein